MYCPKRFATNSNLRQHIRTHTGERPHVCVYPGCGRGFNDATKLSNHQRTHTGERPFVCAVCGNEFVTRNNLKSHMRSHYDPKSAGQRQKERQRRAKLREAADSAAGQQLQLRDETLVQTASKVVTIQRVAQCYTSQCNSGQNRQGGNSRNGGVVSLGREVTETVETAEAATKALVAGEPRIVIAPDRLGKSTRGSAIVVRLRAASPIGPTN